MSGNERVKGVQVHRPVIYGSHARLLTEEEKLTATPGHTHRWTVFFAPAATPPPAKTSATSSRDPLPVDLDYIPGGADDMSYLIKRVMFRLHETYSNPNRLCERPPYMVTETGWGEFTVQIKVTFVPEAGEKALSLQHPIKLHHWGKPIEAPPPAPTVDATPAGTPAADKAEGESEVKKEGTEAPATPATAEGGDAAPATGTPGDGAIVPSGAATPGTAAALSHIQSIAAAYPVHAWHYDEIVFSDPPANFMALLEENPPTPLPTRNRRPRDQREEHELKSGKKKKGAARPSTSRTGTATPAISRANTPRGGTPATTAGTPGGVQIGIPGEPGSADVPLEFTLEMEKAENNRLTEVRGKIVEQMDRWRERLIAQEKELVRLKEEMKAQS